MSIRCIWVISTLSQNLGKVLFYRAFPTVENRVRKAHKDSYAGIPSSDEFSLNLLLALGLSPESKQFVEWRDKATKDVHLPVVTVKVKKNEFSPILVVHQNYYVLCCLPFVEKKHLNDLFYIPSVSVAFSVLLGIISFLGPNTTYTDEFDERFVELNNYLTISVPFGTPADTDSSSIVAFYNEVSFVAEKAYLKLNKVKPSIFIDVCEYVRSTQVLMQGNVKGFDSVAEIYGCVNVKLESLSHVNEVNLALGHSSPGQILSLESIIFHPCVQALTSGGTGGSNVPKKFWFMPVLQHFTLCYYTAHCASPPISGIYKMKGTTSVELFVQLKLNNESINNFQLFEVLIPFFHRGPILNFDFKATQGFLHVSDDKHSLRWKIGPKFSSKSLDAFLTAKVRFPVGLANTQNEPFCVGKNSYIKVFFKRLNETLSGCMIDSRFLVISPPQKVKIFTECSVQNGEYIIWNSAGELPFPVVPKDKWPKE